MDDIRVSRLAWQIPLLVLLVAALLPAAPWHSAAIGPWPLWLSAMPLGHWWMRRRRSVSVRQPRPLAQVLVFPRTRARLETGKRRPRRAA